MHLTFMKKKYYQMLIAGLLGWIVATVGETADSIIAGIYLGEDAVGAVELVAPVFSLLFFLSSLLAIGSSVLFSTAAGKFDTDKTKKICGMALSIAIVIGVIMALLMILGEDLYFNFYSSGEVIDTLGREYYNCFIPLALVYPAYWVLYYLITADGDALNIFIVDIFTAFSNVIFSILLINRIGIYGLGIGTALSQVLSIGILVVHLFKKSNGVKFKLYFNFSEFKECCAIGSTASMTVFYIAIIDIIMNKYIITAFGDAYLAAYAVVNFVINMGACFCCAIDAAGPFMSIAYGEKNPIAMRRVLKMTTISECVLGSFFVIAAEIAAGFLPKIFGVTDPEVFAGAVYAGRILAISYLGICFVYEYIGYLPRIEKFILGNVMALTYMLITPIVFALSFAVLFGWKGLVWGFFITPFASLAIQMVIIIWKYGRKSFPFLIEETEDKYFVYDLALTSEEIAKTRDCAIEELKALKINPSIINKLALIIEESFEIVKEKNAEKRILAECTIVVSKDEIRLTTRDNGIIFDITDSDTSIDSLGTYVAERVMETSKDTAYITAISYNRNSFAWKL